MAGIEAIGVYLPRYRITAEEFRKTTGHFGGRGIEEKTVAGFDEDVATMAVEAVRRAIEPAAAPPPVDALLYASSGGPPQSHFLAEALGLADVHAVDLLGDSTVGLKALATAILAGTSLVVVAEEPRLPPEDEREHPLGAAAVALLVAPAGLARVVVSKSVSRRTSDAAESIRVAAAPLLAKHPAAWAAVGESEPRFPARALGASIRKEGIVSLSARTGDVGACSPLLNLAEVLAVASKGDAVLLAAAGNGAMALLLSVEGKVRTTVPSEVLKHDAARLSHAQYLRHRRATGVERGVLPSQGAYVSQPTYEASLSARYRLMAQRCTFCQTVVFPPRGLCPRCGRSSFQDAPLSRTAKVYAYTVIGRGASPTEFADQQEAIGEYAVAVLEFPEGPRCTFQLTDIDPKAVKIGMPVSAAFRRVYTQEGTTRYGLKFRPA